MDVVDGKTGEIVALQRPQPPSYNSESTSQIAEALAAAQGEIEMPKRTKTGKIEGISRVTGRPYSYEYKYAPLEEVQRVLQKPFASHALAWHQGLVSRGETFFVRTFIRHSSGEWLSSDYPVIADKSGPQGFAAGITYARSYGLSLATGLVAEDDDDAAAVQRGMEEAAGFTEPVAPARPLPSKRADRLAGRADRKGESGPRYAGAFSSSHPEDDSAMPAAKKASAKPAERDIVAEGWRVADNGTFALETFCAALTAVEKKRVGRRLYDAWVAQAQEVDAAGQNEPV